MIRLIKNKPVKYNGVYYDFTGLDQSELEIVYDNNPSLRHMFEAGPRETEISTTEFEEALAKVGILTSNMTAKKLAEIKKRKEDDKTEEE